MPDETPAETPAEQVPPGGKDEARRRAWAALRGRPSRAQVVVGILLALLGFAAAVQVRAVRSDDEYSGAQRDELVQLLQTLSAAQDQASRQFAALEDTRDELLLSTDQRKAALEEAQRRLDALLLLSGQVGATGPDVVITIADPDGNLAPVTLLNAVQELRDAGAEAIEINNVARVVAQTWFDSSSTGATLEVDGQTVRAPYVIEAIGAAETLVRAVDFPGGLADEVETLGGSVTVTQLDAVQVQSLAMETDAELADPST